MIVFLSIEIIRLLVSHGRQYTRKSTLQLLQNFSTNLRLQQQPSFQLYKQLEYSLLQPSQLCLIRSTQPVTQYLTYNSDANLIENDTQTRFLRSGRSRRPL